MVTIEGQKLIIDLSEVEAKIVEKTLPLLSPLLEMLVKFQVRCIFRIALMGKEKWREFRQLVEQEENPEILSQLLHEAIGGPEAIRAMAENLAEGQKFPSLDEIDQMFD
ncbi:hypothetical protein ES703_114347 [subsurface metagenome]